jgi:hypothetical protein
MINKTTVVASNMAKCRSWFALPKGAFCLNGHAIEPGLPAHHFPRRERYIKRKSCSAGTDLLSVSLSCSFPFVHVFHF